jgi:hypothetical protein
MSASDNDRISYLSGESVASLSREERAELDELRMLLETPAAWEEPDPALEDQVLAAVAEEVQRVNAAEAARSTTQGVGATAGAAAAPASPPKTRSSIWSRWRMRRPALAFGGLATAAAAIAVVLVLALGGNSAKPLQFAMVVSGTPLAPGAHGNATLTKTESGWRIELSATGLPHLANGRYYQAWLKNPAGILVPVGTFNDAKQVTLWSGAPVTQFRLFSVTEQLANGNPVSSGRRVLVGIAHPVH